MSNHTYKNPIVFVVVYVSEPGLQMDVSVFETEKDAVTAALAGIKERAPHFNIDFEGALLKYGSEELIDECGVPSTFLHHDIENNRIEIPLLLAEEIAGDVHSPVALVEVHPTHERMEMTLVWLNENRPVDFSNDDD